MGIWDYIVGNTPDPKQAAQSDPTGAYLGNLIDPASVQQFMAARAQQGLLGMGAGMGAAMVPSRLPVLTGQVVGSGIQGLLGAQGALSKQALEGAQTAGQVADSQYKKVESGVLVQNLLNQQNYLKTLSDYYGNGGASPSSSSDLTSGTIGNNMVAGNMVAPVGKISASGAETGTKVAAVLKNEFGWTPGAIAGALNNGFGESGGVAWGNTGSGGENGFFQFHPGSHLKPFLSASGGDTSPEAQARYMAAYVNSTMPDYGKTADSQTATASFLRGFERPKNQSDGEVARRLGYSGQSNAIVGSLFGNGSASATIPSGGAMQGLLPAAANGGVGGVPGASGMPSNLNKAQQIAAMGTALKLGIPPDIAKWATFQPELALSNAQAWGKLGPEIAKDWSIPQMGRPGSQVLVGGKPMYSVPEVVTGVNELGQPTRQFIQAPLSGATASPAPLSGATTATGATAPPTAPPTIPQGLLPTAAAGGAPVATSVPSLSPGGSSGLLPAAAGGVSPNSGSLADYTASQLAAAKARGMMMSNGLPSFPPGSGSGVNSRGDVYSISPTGGVPVGTSGAGLLSPAMAAQMNQQARSSGQTGLPVMPSNLVFGNGMVAPPGAGRVGLGASPVAGNATAAPPTAPIAQQPLQAPQAQSGGGVVTGLSPQQTQEFEATGKTLGSEYGDAVKGYDAAQKALPNLLALQRALEGFRTGPTAEFRLGAMKNIQDIASTLFGADVSDDMKKAIASGEIITKSSTRLGFELARTLGSREAQNIVQQAMNANPNLLNSPQGNEILVSLIGQGLQRDVDRRSYYDQYWQARHSYMGAATAFDKASPATMYERRVFPKSADDVKGLPPGSKFMTPDGKVKTVPGGQ